MYGEVVVPYTPIGGMNMARSASDGSLSGTGQPETGGGDRQNVYVSWRLPGGIVGTNSWDELYGSDEDVWDLLIANGYATADHVINNEPAAVSLINSKIFDYISVVLNDDIEHIGMYLPPNRGGKYSVCTATA